MYTVTHNLYATFLMFNKIMSPLESIQGQNYHIYFSSFFLFTEKLKNS